MDKAYLLGLDAGTSGCKAVVFDNRGEICGYGFSEYPVICDAPAKAEQDAADVMAKLIAVTEQAIRQSGVRRIEAISVSVQGDAAILVDNEYRPLHNAILGMDYRNTAECERLEERIGSREAFRRTGMRIHPINFIAKAMWFKNNAPEAYEKATKVMTYSEFVMAGLGGEPVIDLTMASRTMALDIHTRQWDEQLLEICGVDRAMLSDVRPSGTPCGRLSESFRQRWGLENAPLLVVGGHDQTCGAIGAGMIREGMGVDSSGTAAVFSSAFSAPRLDDAMLDAYYPCYCHAVEGLYFTFALNHTGGIVLRWFRDNIAQGTAAEAGQLSADFYDYIAKNIENSPSPVLVLPHFNGSGTPVCDMQSKGAFVGLTLSTTLEEIFKGILDGLTYELKLNIETMRSAGIALEEVRAVGGGAKSPLWLQTKADILNMPIVTLKCKEAGCLGAAILAAVGSGVYPDIESAVNSMVRVEQTYMPNAQSAARYAEKYSVYKKLYPALKSIQAQL